MLATATAVPQQASAWILWDDGVEELMQAVAIAWAKWVVPGQVAVQRKLVALLHMTVVDQPLCCMSRWMGGHTRP